MKNIKQQLLLQLEDVIIQDNQIVKLSNGSPLLAKITGAGCLLGGLVAGFLFRNTSIITSIRRISKLL